MEIDILNNLKNISNSNNNIYNKLNDISFILKNKFSDRKKSKEIKSYEDLYEKKLIDLAEYFFNNNDDLKYLVNNYQYNEIYIYPNICGMGEQIQIIFNLDFKTIKIIHSYVPSQGGQTVIEPQLVKLFIDKWKMFKKIFEDKFKEYRRWTENNIKQIKSQQYLNFDFNTEEYGLKENKEKEK